MIYELSPQNGDSISVPQIVFNNLYRADENCIRVALYILATQCTDARTIAHDLGLKSIPAATRALQWWAGAGLLTTRRGTAAPAPTLEPAETDMALLLCDPHITMLMEHAQCSFGGTLSDAEARHLVELYTVESIPADVLMLCLSYVAGMEKPGFRLMKSEINRWIKAGVRTGEDAEKYLALLAQREKNENEVCRILGRAPSELSPGEKRSIQRWFEKWEFSLEMVTEASHHAGSDRSVWSINDILKGWFAKGWRTPGDVRGGTVYASNVRVDSSPSVASGNNLTRKLGHPIKLQQEG